MNKLLRKITALALVLIFSGLCCVNAYDLPFSEEFDNGKYRATVTGNINTYSIYGAVWVERITPSIEMLTNVYRSVTVSYSYLEWVDGVLVHKIGTASDTAVTGEFNSNVSIYMSDIYHMVDATFTFKADIPCSYGTQQFRPNPKTIEFEV